MKLLTLTTLISCLVTIGCAEADDKDIETGALVGQCAVCHTEEGIAGIPGWPDLAGMDEGTIVAKLKGHRAGVVQDSTMRKVAVELSDEEIQAVAKHFSSMQKND